MPVTADTQRIVDRLNEEPTLPAILEANGGATAFGTRGLTKLAETVLLLEEGHCLRDHAIAACGPRRGGWESRIEATSLTTLIQMVEGGLGVTLLPRITLDAGILKGTRLVARPFSSPAPSRMLALVARRTSPRRRDADLLAEFLIQHHRRSDRAVPSPQRPSPKA